MSPHEAPLVPIIISVAELSRQNNPPLRAPPSSRTLHTQPYGFRWISRVASVLPSCWRWHLPPTAAAAPLIESGTVLGDEQVSRPPRRESYLLCDAGSDDAGRDAHAGIRTVRGADV